jgi:hypothetical protein
MFADVAANSACDRHLPEIVKELDLFHQDQVSQRTKVLRYFQYNLELQMARAQAMDTGADNHSEPPPRNVREMLCNWSVTNIWAQPDLLNDEEICHSKYGFRSSGNEGSI